MIRHRAAERPLGVGVTRPRATPTLKEPLRVAGATLSLALSHP